MKLPASILAAALALSPGVATAMPHGQLAAPVEPGVERVAIGCGMGRARDAMGHCRRNFNLSDHHDRRHFDRYRDRHCTSMRTPNGKVRRCRI